MGTSAVRNVPLQLQLLLLLLLLLMMITLLKIDCVIWC
jgi:hypothetical protein